MFEPNIFGNDEGKQAIRDTLHIQGSYTFNINSVFSKQEQILILDFCKGMGIEFADLDILRDNGTGKLYIVDVNNIAANTIFSKLGETGKMEVISFVSGYLDALIKIKIDGYKKV